MIPTKQTFIDLAKKCENGEEFYERARIEFKDVPNEVAEWFYQTYNSTEMLSMQKACGDFVKDAKNNEVC